MKRTKIIKLHSFRACFLWAIPLTLFSVDANAWGLVTHLYFAHSLVWATPLLDPHLRRAIQRFPELVMAGACLPDLAIVNPKFKDTHQWQHAHQLLNMAENDETRAIAIGYTSHLYIDVIAHNHFVPAHEAMWMQNDMLTHIVSEWAMDAYLKPLTPMRPGQLLLKYESQLLAFTCDYFDCDKRVITSAIKKLAHADNLLRFSQLPSLLYKTLVILDKRLHKNFIYYIAKTQDAMAQIGMVLDGHVPAWEPEPVLPSKQHKLAWCRQCVRSLIRLQRKPIEYFQSGLMRAYD